MDKKTQQQIVQLVQDAMQQNPEALQKIQQIKQAADSGNQQAAALFHVIQQVAEQLAGQQKQLTGQQTVAAAKGAKLQYLNSLKNKCKEGEELVYMKAGGTFCKKCEKRIQVQAKRGGAVEEFKSKYDKCGGKIKKKEIGGQIQQQKKQQKPAQTQKPTKQTPLPTKWDQKKHDELIRKFKKNPKGMSKAQMDSLHYYNMKDPREQGV